MTIGRNSVLPNGPLIRAQRHARGLSQLALSLKADISLKTIGRMENGEPCFLSTLEPVARVFKVDAGELVLKDHHCPLMRKQKPAFKYFRDMRDVLKWDDENIEPVWFRKSGPLAADFRAGFVYERKGYLDELNSLVSHNKILVFEGTGGAVQRQ